MTALAQHRPLRLAALFFAALGAYALVLAAGLAIFLIVEDQRHQASSGAVVDTPLPASHIAAPPGIIVAVPVDTPEEFEALAGFAPFIPRRVPSSTDAEPIFAVTEPGTNGYVVGRVGFAAKPGADANGISGPSIVIGQVKGTPGEGVDGELKRITSAGRALVATLRCGDLVLDVQLYFAPAPAPGDEIITSDMRSVAQGFIDDVAAQCEGR